MKLKVGDKVMITNAQAIELSDVYFKDGDITTVVPPIEGWEHLVFLDAKDGTGEGFSITEKEQQYLVKLLPNQTKEEVAV